MKIITSAFLLLLLVFFLAPVSAQRLPLNAGMEYSQGPYNVANWTFGQVDNAYVGTVDHYVHKKGKRSYCLDGTKVTHPSFDNNCFIGYALSLADLNQPKHIHFSAWVYSDCAAPSSVALYYYPVSSQAPVTSYYRMTDRVSKNGGWIQLELDYTPLREEKMVYFGGMLCAKGKAWFDEFEIIADGKLVKDTYKGFKPEHLKQDVAYLDQHLHPLTSPDLGAPSAELTELGNAIGNARIVGVGEPTHGTSEAFRFKERLFAYLVENKGFNTFVLEDNMPEAELFNDYILEKSPNAKALMMSYLFPVWRNQELLHLIEWMRSYNQKHPNKLRFRGMDMQSIRVLQNNISRIAQVYDPALAPLNDELKRLYVLHNKSQNVYTYRDSVLRAAKSLDTYFNEHLINYQKKISKDSLIWYQQNMIVLHQMMDNLGWTKGDNYRDSCMARNVRWVMEQAPDSKILIWAHNAHVNLLEDWLGNYLRTQYGKDYFALGCLTAKGDYTASADFAKTSWGSWALITAYPGTEEYYLMKARKSNYYLLLNEFPATAMNAAWVSNSLEERLIGFPKTMSQFHPAIPLNKRYDAIVFFNKTHHAKSFMFKKG